MNRIRTACIALSVAGITTAATQAQSRLQILHASDLEGGVDAVDDAPNFAAIVEALENDAANSGTPSILLSSGDNYIPGPFFSAAGDGSLRTVLRSVLGQPDAREGDGRVDMAIMNVLGFDAAAVGNHEFDNGTGTFASIIGTVIRSGTEARWLGAQFPYLSANLDFSGDSALSGLFTATIQSTTAFESPLSNLAVAAAAPKLAPAALVQRGSETIGIVGATTPLVESISSTGGVTVRNPGAGTNDMVALAAILQPTIDAVIATGTDKVILVTHLQQFALEQTLTPLLRGVDVVIAGGSDTLLADATDRLRAGDAAQGPYPFVTQNADGDPAVIVSTDGQYSYVGRLVIDFDASGVVDPASVMAAQSGVFATDNQGVIDLYGSLAGGFAPGSKGETVQTLAGAVRQVVIARDGNIVGRSNVFLEGRRTPVRTEETNFGDLTAEANLAAARSFDSTVLVSHKNGGGIRNPIGSIDGVTGALGPNLPNPLSGKQAGEISQLDIENTLRFNNGLTLLTLDRSQFKAVLEHAVAATGPGSTPGQFGQFSGVSFSFDPSRAPGDRVRFASLTDSSVSDPIVVADGTVMGSGSIRIVTLDFLAGGGDSYPFPSFVAANAAFANEVALTGAGLPAGASTFAPAGSEQDALAEYLLANFSAVGFGTADTPVDDDQLVQQIGTRPGLSVSGTGLPSTQLVVSISGATPNALSAWVIAERSARTELSFGFGSVLLGMPVEANFFLGMTDANGVASTSIAVPSSLPGLLRYSSQGLVLDGVTSAGVQASTTEAQSFTVGQ